MKNKLVIAFLLVTVLHGTNVSAWGVLGHRIVGQIAYSYLTPKARLGVAGILGNESVAMSSNWADFIKSDPTYNYLGPWHYADMDDGLSYAAIQNYFAKDTATDAYTKLNFLISGLRNKGLPKTQQLMYLRLIIHIVGDLHQPMHIGKKEDAGGNKVRLTWFNDPTNLHAVWDEKLINFQQLSYTEYANAINYTTSSQRALWQNQPITQWIYESYELRNKIYRETKENDKLSY
ncbi:MAG: Nuclease, partial [Chitinophagaceae bacterium]|nr:Nuclease [Chitinophagaceae bacterium]